MTDKYLAGMVLIFLFLIGMGFICIPIFPIENTYWEGDLKRPTECVSFTTEAKIVDVKILDAGVYQGYHSYRVILVYEDGTVEVEDGIIAYEVTKYVVTRYVSLIDLLRGG